MQLVRQGERALLELVRTGGPITRAIVDRSDEGWRLLLWLDKLDVPVTLSVRRGGTRRWAQLNTLVRWIEKNLPEERMVELYFGQFSDLGSDSASDSD